MTFSWRCPAEPDSGSGRLVASPIVLTPWYPREPSKPLSKQWYVSVLLASNAAFEPDRVPRLTERARALYAGAGSKGSEAWATWAIEDDIQEGFENRLHNLC